MTPLNKDVSRLLSLIVGHLDVPKSYYEKAADRHRSLAEWLCRPESQLAIFDPDVRPQGSFRYGTVNRPIDPDDEYDLDNVCVLTKLDKTTFTQQQLKELYGTEIKAYAKAKNMLAPVEEHKRCWRLRYADEVKFHLDTLPCVPEEQGVVRRLIAAGVAPELACCAVAITDKRHPQYREITSALFSSNPRGFARWFEQRAALGRVRTVSEGRAKAAVEDVPPYEWKTPLQRSIQLLKRHRDVMFLKEPALEPISMIITNLAARSYDGETDLWEALWNIVNKMETFVRSARPYVPNPADPAEDYADKWVKEPVLQENFWRWLVAVKADVAKLPSFLRNGRVHDDVNGMFHVELTEEEIREFEVRAPAVTKSAPAVIIASAPRPWGQ